MIQFTALLLALTLFMACSSLHQMSYEPQAVEQQIFRDQITR